MNATPPLHATAFAPANIALAKYWGKRDSSLNLPANGSISITLERLGSTTTVAFEESSDRDRFLLNGPEVTDARALSKISAVLDALRAEAGLALRARVESANNFPTGAGLASSASGLCALTLAASRALGLALPQERLSAIARLGSGSACRSFHGGFVEWRRGELADGSDSVGVPLRPPSHWDLRVFLAITHPGEKPIASTEGMNLVRETSPYFPAWVESAQASLPRFRGAIERRDFGLLAEESERSCLRMHACAMTATPPILYWNPATVEILRLARSLRAEGMEVFFTIDAGANVAVIATAGHAPAVRARLAGACPGLLETGIGEGALIL